MKPLLFLLMLTSCNLEQLSQPDCNFAHLEVYSHNARLIFDDNITGNVSFAIETPNGLVPGYWTPDMFKCIGWTLDSQEHELTITYGGCTQNLIIPAINY